MDGARFKMLPAFGLLLLLSWSLTCVHGTAFDIHDLIFYIFGINKEDVRYLDKLVGIHTKNGVFDKDGYDNQLKQNNPLLHAIMEKFRETYREVEKENREAVGFIDDLFHTARKLRDSGSTLHYAMEL
ncbi:hypothetical protein GCK32_018113 [Trichostrongylus colubriformis]|uniref:Uncharacterized protein n=1 Tax=Trichostrongylus colubriformis TaxID=6319 RepID=A0AAN8IJ02_TRICO